MHPCTSLDTSMRRVTSGIHNIHDHQNYFKAWHANNSTACKFTVFSVWCEILCNADDQKLPDIRFKCFERLNANSFLLVFLNDKHCIVSRYLADILVHFLIHVCPPLTGEVTVCLKRLFLLVDTQLISPWEQAICYKILKYFINGFFMQ